jgi:hypothetical protein
MLDILGEAGRGELTAMEGWGKYKKEGKDV